MSTHECMCSCLCFCNGVEQLPDLGCQTMCQDARAISSAESDAS